MPLKDEMPSEFIDLTLPLTAAEWERQGIKRAARGHIGTHLDVPEGFRFPLEKLILPARVIDLSHLAVDTEIQVDDLSNELRPGEALLCYTGWLSQTHPDETYYRNGPQLSWTALEYLKELQPPLIGLDASGVRRPAEHDQADKLLLAADVLVIENLVNLEKIVGLSVKLYCFPLRLEGTTGLPVRVIAETQSN